MVLFVLICHAQPDASHLTASDIINSGPTQKMWTQFISSDYQKQITENITQTHFVIEAMPYLHRE